MAAASAGGAGSVGVASGPPPPQATENATAKMMTRTK